VNKLFLIKRWWRSVDSWLKRVRFERGCQLRKWGAQTHSISDWHAIVSKEFGECSEQVVEIILGNKASTAELQTELVHLAVSALAMAQAITEGAA
jgi:hypothetical protein